MAEIPLAIDNRGRPSLRVQQRISSDQSGQILAGAIGEAGTAIAGAAEQQLDIADKFAFASAKTALLTGEIKLRRELESDDDWESWEDRYMEGVAKLRDDVIGGIRNRQDQQAFAMESEVDLERGITEMRRAAMGREIDTGKAQLSADLESLRTAAYDAPDFASKQEMIRVANGLIAGARDRDLPFITDLDAEAMQQAWTKDYATAMVTMMQPQARAAMLAEPTGTIAQYIPKPIREKMLKAAQEEGKSERDLLASQQAVDRIIEKNPDDRAAALVEARKLKGEVRRQTENAINQRYGEKDVVANEDRKAKVAEGTSIIDTTGSISNMPRADFLSLPIADRTKLQAYEKYVIDFQQRGIEPTHNDVKYDEWNRLSNQEQLDTNVLVTYRPFFDDRHFDVAQARWQSLKDASEGDGSANDRVIGADNQRRMIESALLDSPFFNEVPEAKTGNADKRRWARIFDQINRRIVDEKAEAQGDKQKIIDEMISERVFTADAWWGAGDARSPFGAPPADLRSGKFYIPIEEMPEDVVIDFRRLAESVNAEPTDKQIASAYLAFNAGASDSEIKAILKK